MGRRDWRGPRGRPGRGGAAPATPALTAMPAAPVFGQRSAVSGPVGRIAPKSGSGRPRGFAEFDEPTALADSEVMAGLVGASRIADDKSGPVRAAPEPVP